MHQRTLEYAFLDYTNLTPKAYLKAKRYAELRRILATDGECLSVMEAASQLQASSNSVEWPANTVSSLANCLQETLASRRT